jgi:hypothetical protein
MPEGGFSPQVEALEDGPSDFSESRSATTAALVIDPPDDYTFWYVNQYIPTNGSFNFHTRLASLRFPACP